MIRENGKIIKYDADYSVEFDNRTLVDKEYVDNAVAGGGAMTETSGTITHTIQVDIDNSTGNGTGISAIDTDTGNPSAKSTVTNANIVDTVYDLGTVNTETKTQTTNDNNITELFSTFNNYSNINQTYDSFTLTVQDLENSRGSNFYIFQQLLNLELVNALGNIYKSTIGSDYILHKANVISNSKIQSIQLYPTGGMSNIGTVDGSGMLAHDGALEESAGYILQADKLENIIRDNANSTYTRQIIRKNRIESELDSKILTIDRAYSYTINAASTTVNILTIDIDNLFAGDVYKVEFNIYGDNSDNTKALNQKLTYVLKVDSLGDIYQVGGTDEEIFTDFNLATKVSFAIVSNQIVYTFNMNAADNSLNIKTVFNHKITNARINSY